MKKINNSGITVASLALTMTMLLSGCAANEQPGSGTSQSNAGQLNTGETQTGNLIGSGASSQAEAQNTWIASFLQKHEGAEITYDPAGSGAGRENFQQGAVAFAGSDRAFKIEEITAGPFNTCTPDSNLVQLPAYISPIAVIFNLDGIRSLNLDAETLAKIFLGEITNWSNDEIATQNPGTSLPDLPITAVHRADKSGTTGNFTDYLAGASSSWSHGSVEEWPISAGESAPQTSGVVNAVAGGNGTIGYVDASRAQNLGVVSIKVGEEYVPYSPEAAAAVVDASELEQGRSENDLTIKLDRSASESGVYPIVLISYLIACEEYKDEATASLVKEYFNYVVSSEGQAAAAENSGSAPISDSLRKKAESAIATIK